MATHSSILDWKIPWTEAPGRLHTVHGVAKSPTRLSDFTFTFTLNKHNNLILFKHTLIVILSEVREREIHMISLICRIKTEMI